MYYGFCVQACRSFASVITGKSTAQSCAEPPTPEPGEDVQQKKKRKKRKKKQHVLEDDSQGALHAGLFLLPYLGYKFSINNFSIQSHIQS